MNIDKFTHALPKGGARPSLFEIEGHIPGTAEVAARAMRFTTQATTIPAGTIDPIEVSYFGRIYKLPGGRTFEDWNTTVLNREDFLVRAAIEAWMDNINGNATNVEAGAGAIGGTVGMGVWTTDITVKQLNTQGGVSRKYKLHNCWPTMLTEITLDWAEATAIETFDITWAYSHWTNENVDGHDSDTRTSTDDSLVKKTSTALTEIANTLDTASGLVSQGANLLGKFK